jgi:hypothetical protein
MTRSVWTNEAKLRVASGIRRHFNVWPALFLDFMKRGMVIPYRRFGTTYRSHFQGSSSPRRPRCVYRRVLIWSHAVTRIKYPQRNIYDSLRSPHLPIFLFEALCMVTGTNMNTYIPNKWAIVKLLEPQTVCEGTQKSQGTQATYRLTVFGAEKLFPIWQPLIRFSAARL